MHLHGEKSLLTQPMQHNTVTRGRIKSAAFWGVLTCAAVLLLSGGAWAAGGDLLWEDQFEPAGGEDSAFAVAAHGGRVVAGGRSFLRTYDGDSGRLLWEYPFGSADAVAIHSKRVAAVGGGLVRAYDSRTGELLWVAPGSRDIAMSGRHVITLVPGDLVASYDRDTGEVQWVSSDPGAATGFTLHGGKTFTIGTVSPGAASKCVVRAYVTNTGKQLWETVDEACRGFAIAAGGNRVIVAGQGSAGLDDYQVQGYRASDGKLLWEDRTFVSTGFDNGAIAVDKQGKLAFAVGWVRFVPVPFDQEAFLTRAYNVIKGRLIWEDQFFPSDQQCLCHALDVTVHRRQVFVVGTDVAFSRFQVLAYDKHDGDLMWEDHVVKAGSAQAVAADRNRVYAVGSLPNFNGNSDFIIRAYDAK